MKPADPIPQKQLKLKVGSDLPLQTPLREFLLKETKLSVSATSGITVGKTHIRICNNQNEPLPLQFTKHPETFLCPVQPEETVTLRFEENFSFSFSKVEISYEGKLLAFDNPLAQKKILVHKPKLTSWEKVSHPGKKENDLNITVFPKSFAFIASSSSSPSPVALEKTPKDLGWKEGQEVCLSCVDNNNKTPEKLESQIEILFVNQQEFQSPEPIYVKEFVAGQVEKMKGWDFKSEKSNRWLKQIASLYTKNLGDCTWFLDRIYPPLCWQSKAKEDKKTFFIRKSCVSKQPLDSSEHYSVVQLPFACFLTCLPVKYEEQSIVQRYFQIRIHQEIGPYNFSPVDLVHRSGGFYEETHCVEEKLFKQGSLDEVYINSNPTHTDFEIIFHFFGGGYNPLTLEQVVKTNPQLPWIELVTPTASSLSEPNYFIKRFTETIRRGTIGGCIFYSALACQLLKQHREKDKMIIE